ncbi:LuxR C-terminal-related transcriptional regulator [Streptomyces sp. NPDC001296]
MTTTSAPSPLTWGELRVATLVAHGLTDEQISDKLGITCRTVGLFKTKIRRRLDCPFRCSTAVLVHRLYQLQLVSPPDVPTKAPELDEQDERLLRALTERSRPYDIAKTAGIPAKDHHSTLAGLLDKAGVDNTTQLVIRAHAWGLVDTNSESAGTAVGAER